MPAGPLGRGLNSAPVQVRFTSETRKGVLTVPVGALMALREGGYAVQLPGGRLVAVRTGMFSKGLVEVSGTGIDAGTKVAVLGSVAASRLGIPRITPGQSPPQIYIDHRWFTVVGVLRATPLSPDIDRSVLVGWDAARTLLKFGGHPTVIYLKARESQIEAVRDVLPATIDPELPGVVQVSRPSDALAAKRATESTFSALFLGLAGVALLVGGVGVANTMVISVLERRREIGLRRALGANRGQIRAQFLTESVVLSSLGGLAGTALGTLATLAYAVHQHWPPVVPLTSVAAGFVGAVLIGMLAGVYPSLRAARLTPTEALATT